MRFETVIKFEIRNPKHEWFDKPFDRLTVLSKVEGLSTLLVIRPFIWDCFRH